MKKPDVVSWKEIYDYWCLYSMHGPSILNLPISPTELYVDFSNHDGVFWTTVEIWTLVSSFDRFLLLEMPIYNCFRGFTCFKEIGQAFVKTRIWRSEKIFTNDFRTPMSKSDGLCVKCRFRVLFHWIRVGNLDIFIGISRLPTFFTARKADYKRLLRFQRNYGCS
jgi:hypothetical protein